MISSGVRYFEPYYSLSGGNSEWEPPDPIPNSEVKLLSADGSTGFPRARVGHCQALNNNPGLFEIGVFLCIKIPKSFIVLRIIFR